MSEHDQRLGGPGEALRSCGEVVGGTEHNPGDLEAQLDTVTAEQ